MSVDDKVRTLDPKKYEITFGEIDVTGLMDATVINIAGNGEEFEKLRGTDSGVDRVNKNVSDYRVTLTLKCTSPTNDKFSAALLLDKATGAGIKPLVIRDLSGTSKFVAPQAWIAKSPDGDWADTITPREWGLDTGIAFNNIGSNE